MEAERVAATESTIYRFHTPRAGGVGSKARRQRTSSLPWEGSHRKRIKCFPIVRDDVGSPTAAGIAGNRRPSKTLVLPAIAASGLAIGYLGGRLDRRAGVEDSSCISGKPSIALVHRFCE
ncbi:hypothetical protein BJ6T_42550 [Bradyrhizobium japonicum USDA 6]|nr:hypothetical protein BJ6T_42550 [Bradyrhizobium japonicum USDA 6]